MGNIFNPQIFFYRIKLIAQKIFHEAGLEFVCKLIDDDIGMRCNGSDDCECGAQLVSSVLMISQMLVLVVVSSGGGLVA